MMVVAFIWFSFFVHVEYLLYCHVNHQSLLLYPRMYGSLESDFVVCCCFAVVPFKGVFLVMKALSTLLAVEERSESLNTRCKNKAKTEQEH